RVPWLKLMIRFIDPVNAGSGSHTFTAFYVQEEPPLLIFRDPQTTPIEWEGGINSIRGNRSNSLNETFDYPVGHATYTRVITRLRVNQNHYEKTHSMFNLGGLRDGACAAGGRWGLV